MKDKLKNQSIHETRQQEQGIPEAKRTGGQQQGHSSADEEAKRRHGEAARDAVQERDLNLEEDEEITELGDKSGF